MKNLINQTLNETRFERGLIADASDAREHTRELIDLLSSIKALLHCNIALADRHGLDEIRISVPRVREIHRDVTIAHKRATDVINRKTERQHALDAHLDAIHNL